MKDLHTFLYIIRRIESRRKRETEVSLVGDNMRYLGYLDFKRSGDLCKEKTCITNLGLSDAPKMGINSPLSLRQIITRNYS